MTMKGDLIKDLIEMMTMYTASDHPAAKRQKALEKKVM